MHKKIPRKNVNKSYSIRAPVGGLNTRDPLALMEENFAIYLENCTASPSGVAVRKGNKKWATGMTGQVETLMPYSGVSGVSDKLFAAVGTNFYDVTSPGAVGAASQSSLTNARWDYVNFAGVAGQYLICANGVNAVRHWNGTAWVTWVDVSPAAPAAVGEVKDISPTLLSGVISHQKRLWFVQANTSKAWYSPVQEIGGDMNMFEFGTEFPRGGALVALGSWTVNSNTSLVNRLVAVSENGDIVIYDGTDVSDATKWSLAGTWRLGKPIGGTKCLFNYGGDMLYNSIDGVTSLSKFLQTENTTSTLSDKIRPTLSSLALTGADLYGWQMFDALSNNALIINVPNTDPTRNVQFIFNTITGGWSLFTGWGAQCWAALGNDIYFGANGEVRWAFQTFKDNILYDNSGGDMYTAKGQTAFSYLEKRALTKNMKMARMNIISGTSNPTISLGANMDFSTAPPDAVTSSPTSNTSLWNTGLWNGAVWSDELVSSNEWQSMTGTGYCVSLTFSISVLTETVWISTDWIYENGSMIG